MDKTLQKDRKSESVFKSLASVVRSSNPSVDASLFKTCIVVRCIEMEDGDLVSETVYCQAPTWVMRGFSLEKWNLSSS